MTRIDACRTLLAVGALAVAGVVMLGCSSQSASSPASSSASGPASATATSPAPSAAASTTRVPMQTATGGEFLSPSGNISCEVSLTTVYCQTDAPARSVTMTAAGQYKTCSGVTCLGNPGEKTPTLAYGKATGVGSFLCVSATAGVTCTADGKGFRISASGITSVSA